VRQLRSSCGCSNGRLRTVVLWLLPVLLGRTLLLHLLVLVVGSMVLLVVRRVVVPCCRGPLLLRVVGCRAGTMLQLLLL
jgi:hypothetical protein